MTTQLLILRMMLRHTAIGRVIQVMSDEIIQRCASTRLALAGQFVQRYVGVFYLAGSALGSRGEWDGCAVRACCALRGLPGILSLLRACALVQNPGFHLSKSAARQPLTGVRGKEGSVCCKTGKKIEDCFDILSNILEHT